MQANTTELDGRDRAVSRSSPVDRDQLRALRALRAVFGDVQVVGVDDNLPDVPGTPTPAHAQLRVDGGGS